VGGHSINIEDIYSVWQPDCVVARYIYLYPIQAPTILQLTQLSTSAGSSLFFGNAIEAYLNNMIIQDRSKILDLKKLMRRFRVLVDTRGY
jgi:hypothetical protein